MISYERIGFGKYIDLSGKNTRCMICNCSYFSDGFKYQPYVCNACHDFSMAVMNLSDFFIINIGVLTIGSIFLVLMKKML